MLVALSSLVLGGVLAALSVLYWGEGGVSCSVRSCTEGGGGC